MKKKEPISNIGQYSLFDNSPVVKRQPCEYSFPRYIGQLVYNHNGTHRIKEIEPYYTIFDDNTVGTPHDLIPLDKNEHLESIEVEIEYMQYRIKTSKHGDSTAEKNLTILRQLKEKLQNETSHFK